MVIDSLVEQDKLPDEILQARKLNDSQYKDILKNMDSGKPLLNLTEFLLE